MNLSVRGAPKLSAAEKETLLSVLSATEEPCNFGSLEEMRAVVAAVVREFAAPAAAADLLKKLQSYRFVEQVGDLTVGQYLRWFPVGGSALHRGGTLCNIDAGEEGIFLNLRVGAGGARFFRINMNGALFFHKLSTNEELLLRAADAVEL